MSSVIVYRLPIEGQPDCDDSHDLLGELAFTNFWNRSTETSTREGKQKEVDLLDLNSVLAAPPYVEPIEIDGKPALKSRTDQIPNYMANIAEEFPNVRALTDVIFFNDAALRIQRPVLEELVHFRKLEALTLIGTVGGPDDLQALKQLPNLRQLDLTSVDLIKGNGEFPILSQLRTLRIGPRSHATDRLLASIAHLPRLETLVLNSPFGSDSSHSITAEGFRELRPSTSLKTLYLSLLNADNVPIPQKPGPTPPLAVGAPPPRDWWQTNLLGTAAMALPGVAIRNSYLFPVRNLVPFFMGAGALGFSSEHIWRFNEVRCWLGSDLDI